MKLTELYLIVTKLVTDGVPGDTDVLIEKDEEVHTLESCRLVEQAPCSTFEDDPGDGWEYCEPGSCSEHEFMIRDYNPEKEKHPLSELQIRLSWY